jgi:hypothetical protein
MLTRTQTTGAGEMKSFGKEAREMNPLNRDGISSDIASSSAARLSTLCEREKSKQETKR